jgi:hypothetical protein
MWIPRNCCCALTFTFTAPSVYCFWYATCIFSKKDYVWSICPKSCRLKVGYHHPSTWEYTCIYVNLHEIKVIHPATSRLVSTSIIYFCTCWVPIISVLNITIFSCYSNLPLRRWKWTEILRRVVLCLRCPSCFPVVYVAFLCSAFVRVVLVFWRYYLCNNYTLFMTLAICEHFFYLAMWNKWSWAHMQWVFDFGRKTGYDTRLLTLLRLGWGDFH